MTTVYVPRVIRTAEDAAALPEGAFVFDDLGLNSERFVQSTEDWHCDGWPGTLTDAIRAAKNGRTAYPVALVPVEAHEEWASVTAWESWGYDAIQTDRRDAEGDAQYKGDPRITRRYVTEWEDA